MLLSSDPNTFLIVGRENISNWGIDQMVTFQVVGNEGRPDNPIGSFVLAWDDGMSIFGDRDFQDTVIEVSGIGLAVPEPSSVVLIGSALLIGGLYLRSRGRTNTASALPRTSWTKATICAIAVAGTMFFASVGVAALTPIFHAEDFQNNPSLIGINPYPGNLQPSVLETLYGEQNLRRIDDDFDKLFVFTQDQATFKAVAQFSGNPFSMAISIPGTRDGGVSVLRLPEFIGAPGYPGYEIPEPRESVIARSSIREQVFPFSILARGSGVWSDPSRNIIKADRLVTFEVVGNIGHPDNPIGSLLLCWEDQGFASSDRDFQDLVVEVRGIGLAVPEPSTAVTIALSVVAIAVWRTRILSFNKRGR